MSRVQVKLSQPIIIDKAEVSALTVDPVFRMGWLRSAPATPGWLIAVVKSVLADLPADAGGKDLDPGDLLKNLDIPIPSGEEVSAMIPWLLHVAGKATGQPEAVVDQLGPVDLLSILVRLMPGMAALPHFPKAPASGSATSPGSSAGAPQK